MMNVGFLAIVTLVMPVQMTNGQQESSSCPDLVGITAYFQQVSPKLARIFRFRVRSSASIPELSRFANAGETFLQSAS